MQISDILNQMNQQTTISGSAASTATMTAEYADGNRTLTGLKEGEVFEGTVMDVENGKVTISLANGSSISARLDTGVYLTQGLATFFQVKSNQGGQIALKAVTQDNFSNPTLVKALTQAGVQVSTRNLDLVKEMMSQQLSIDTKSVLNMVRAANSFPSANVETLAQLEKLSLPINELNIEQLEHYNQGEGRIQKNLEAIIKALPELIREAPGQEGGLNIAKQILSLFTGEAGGLSLQDRQSGTATTAGQAATQISETTGQEADAAGAGSLGQQPDTPEAADQPASHNTDATMQIAGEQAMETGIPDQQPATVTAAGQAVSQNTDITGVSEQKPGVMVTKDQAASQTIDTAGTQSQQLDTTETPGQIRDPVKQLQLVMEWIDNGQVSKEQLSELFSKPSFQQLIQDAANKQWFISPPEVGDKQKLAELYERIDRQMSKLQDIFSGAGRKDSPVVRQMADTRSNISFLNQINHFYNYVQIPLRMTNQNATGDLYVYTNRKNPGKKSGELSAHLHLEMEHLGTTDVFIRLNQKKLSTNFVMEDEKSLDLVMDHIDILTDRLQKKGYEMDVQIKENPDKAEQAMFLQEVIGQQSQQAVVSRYSFDVKV